MCFSDGRLGQKLTFFHSDRKKGGESGEAGVGGDEVFRGDTTFTGFTAFFGVGSGKWRRYFYCLELLFNQSQQSPIYRYGYSQ